VEKEGLYSTFLQPEYTYLAKGDSTVKKKSGCRKGSRQKHSKKINRGEQPSEIINPGPGIYVDRKREKAGRAHV